jgi:hypothetical protein
MIKNIATLTAAAVSLGTAAALAFAPASATAETAAFRDAHGDMAHGADIYRVKVVNENDVRVKIRTADLVRSYKSGASAAVFLDTDPEQDGPEFAFLGGLFEGTDYALVRTNGWKVGKHPQVVRGFHTMTLDYQDDVARIRISRGALDHPGKVRVAVKTGGEQRDGDIVRDWLHGRRDFSPWVARG